MLLDTLDFLAGPQPDASIIILHGLGADANDFVPFTREIDLSGVAVPRWVFPNAPVRPVTLNGGMAMRAWYDISSLDFDQRREDEPGLRASREQVQALIDREVARGIAPGRIVLAGFSQGSAMTLLTGLRAPQRLAGLVGLSGYLPLQSRTEDERHDANRDVPVFMGHGRHDGIVPIGRGRDTRDALMKLGHPVEWHEYPVEHGVSAEEVSDLEAWLRRVLARG